MATVRDHSKSQGNEPHDDLKIALAVFESCLLAPAISGELIPWLEAVQKSWEELSAQVHFHARGIGFQPER